MLKIYGVPMSVHTRKVIVAAIEKGLAYENEPVIPYNPPAGWETLSPTGKIPVLLADDRVVCDSTVICAYLEQRRPNPPLYPDEPEARIDALWFEEYADGTLFREVVHPQFYQQIIRPQLLNEAPDSAAIGAILNQAMPRAFAYLERSLERGDLASDAFSVATIAIVSNLINLRYLGRRIDEHAYPQLAGYFDRHLQRASIQRALEAEQPFVQAMGLAQILTAKAA